MNFLLFLHIYNNNIDGNNVLIYNKNNINIGYLNTINLENKKILNLHLEDGVISISINFLPSFISVPITFLYGTLKYNNKIIIGCLSKIYNNNNKFEYITIKLIIIERLRIKDNLY